MPKKKTSANKTYFYKEVEYELVGFKYKRQVSFEDCRLQFISTFIGNKTRGMSNSYRKNGLPDEFCEGLVRHHYLNLVSFTAREGKKGDMFCEHFLYLWELKTLTSNGPTSFSPTSRSEWYVFCEVDMTTSEYKLYRVHHSLLATAKVNGHTTLGQQWEINEATIAAGQTAPRPRFNIKNFLEKNEVQSEFTGYLLEDSKIDSINKKTLAFWEDING